MSAALAAATPPRRVVICGGGVVAACTAYFLSTHAVSPTVPTLIEECAPACAASGKADGFLALDWVSFSFDFFSLAAAPFSPTVRRSRNPETLDLLSSSELSFSQPHEHAPDGGTVVHPGLFTKAVLAASCAEVVIGEVERVVARDGRVAVVVVKGRDAVVDADAVVLALGPWSGRLEVVAEVFDVSGLKRDKDRAPPA
ncbi:unnamed protein product [Miscanthus lutarioriparius]|uniref:FAD dependent oxidoreductase domain-containing protein n=1 Tax=Miscanthus lutarioriparius TaxID=422564 RepID=A0A811NNR9_9POAL|nr:unnamed protein product [Miscanthus lutarioriparius]